MRTDLANLLRLIHHARTTTSIADIVTECGRALLSADAVGFAFETQPGGEQVRIVGLPDSYASTYRRIGRPVDPVLAEIVGSHQPVMTNRLLSSAAWHSHPFYVNIASRFGLQHIMAAPIIGPTGVVGKVSAGRRGTEDVFLRSDLAVLSVIAAHVSVAFAVNSDQRPRPAALTAREMQIVELVAMGATNADIGRRLGISVNTVKDALKTVFRKTGARRRAQLAAFVAGPDPQLDR